MSAIQKRKVIINYPGMDGTADGYEGKYKKLEEYILSNNLATDVVRLSNPYTNYKEHDHNLRNGIEKALNDKTPPDLYLMGTSIGAGSIALLAWEYPEVKKILLLEPACVPTAHLDDALQKYKGEIYIVVGDSDNALGEKTGSLFYNAATHAINRELIVIKNCDHHFSGTTNGRILSQAPFWAFSDTKPTGFPNPNGGIELYI